MTMLTNACIRCITFTEMFGSCLVMFTVAALYEGLKVLREWLLKRSLVRRGKRGSVAVPNSEEPVATTRFVATHSLVIQVNFSYVN
jgi:Ctr copper transporter family